MKTQDLLTIPLQGKSFTRLQSREIFLRLFNGKLSENQAKELLLSLAVKGETVPEVVGCLEAFRKCEPRVKTPFTGLIDTCGTGGDGSHSFNISTIAAFVVAGAGGKVAKHGNRSISSKSGSSDILRELGVNIAAPKAKMIKAIKLFGIGYFHAPLYHPVFAKMQPLRQALGVRTIFNLLGPLLNPCAVKHQLIGIAKKPLLKLYQGVLTQMNYKSVWICHSHDGMDEISSVAKTDVIKITGKTARKMTVDPRKLGLSKGTAKSYAGGTAKQNAKKAISLLQGKVKGPLRDVVLLNAAASLTVLGKAKTLQNGLRLATASLESGVAYNSLEGLRNITK